MQISQTVDFGQISHTYMSTWKDNNEVELYAGEDKVVFTMSEEKYPLANINVRLTSIGCS